MIGLHSIFICVFGIYRFPFFKFSEKQNVIASNAIKRLLWMPDACRFVQVLKPKLSLLMFTQRYNCHTVYQRITICNTLGNGLYGSNKSLIP